MASSLSRRVFAQGTGAAVVLASAGLPATASLPGASVERAERGGFELDPVAQGLRDQAYNNKAAAPQGAARLKSFTEASREVRARFGGTIDLPYASGGRTKLDLFPAQDPYAPCLVYFHGGYWQSNAREMFAVLGEGVREAGWSVAMPGYTLAPDASLTQIVKECLAAVDWLATRGADKGIRGSLIVCGSSAGGMLASLALEHPAVVAGLAVSGVFELAPLRGTYLDEKLSLTDAEIVNLSPMRRPVVHKPLAIAYGARELPSIIAQSAAFHALRRAAGASGGYIALDGHDHFSILEDLRHSDGVLTQTLSALAAPR